MQTTNRFNAAAAVRAAIPGADESLIGYILWGRTSYPFGKIGPRQVYEAADRLRRASISGVKLCDMCDNRADEGWTCKQCSDAFSACQE